MTFQFPAHPAGPVETNRHADEVEAAMDVQWSGTPRPDTPDWPAGNAVTNGACGSCGRETTLRPDPIVGQLACRPCWEGMMFDD